MEHKMSLKEEKEEKRILRWIEKRFPERYIAIRNKYNHLKEIEDPDRFLYLRLEYNELQDLHKDELRNEIIGLQSMLSSLVPVSDLTYSDLRLIKKKLDQKESIQEKRDYLIKIRDKYI